MTTVSGATRLAAVIGDPARHSLSPALHNAAFRALGLDWIYLAFDVARGDAVAALDAMRVLGIDGYSVTMPHKTDVAHAVDERSATAAALDAVNCVVHRDGRLVGHNTDGEGFLRGLRHDTGIDPAGARCVVLGAGGAARAVVHALAGAGVAEVVVVNRSPGPAEVAAALAGPIGRAGDVEAVAHADVVVNATPVGMHGSASAAPHGSASAAPHGSASAGPPCPPELLRPGQIVVDLIYDPFDTPLTVAARAAGATAHNGLSMLVFQAAAAFELWTGLDAPAAAMLAAAGAALHQKAAGNH
jgi:shikimate dehydrogenase